MKKKLLVLLVVLLVASFGFMRSPAKAAQDRLVYACFRVGTSFYFEAVGLTQLLNQYTNFTAIVQPYPAPASVIKALHDRKADIQSQNKRWAHDYTFGDKSLLKHAKFYPEIRAIMGSQHVPFGWVTRPDTGIKSIADLKGRKVTFKIPGLTLSPLMSAASLRAVGIDPDKDVKHIPFPNSPAAARGLKSKKIDAMWGALATSYLQAVKATVGLEVIPFPPELFAKLRQNLKESYALRELPKGYYTTIQKKMYVAGLPSVVIAREDLPDEVAYQVVKLSTEKVKVTRRIHKLFREHGRPEYQVPDDFMTPYHRGAIKYYKEAGIWTSAYEARQQKLMDKLQKLVQSRK